MTMKDEEDKLIDNDEPLEIRRCVCGGIFDFWEYAIGTRQWINPCPQCGRKFYFDVKVFIYEITDE